MLNKNYQTADIMENQGADRRDSVIVQGVKHCCPFLNRVRYHKIESLKDKKIFTNMNGGYIEKKRKTHDKIEENAGTSMMYYL
jgi:hypothetical protein